MARVSHPKDFLREAIAKPLPLSPASPSRSNSKRAKRYSIAVLEELNVKQTENIPAVAEVTSRLENFHIGDGPEKAKSLRGSRRKAVVHRAALPRRPALESETFLPPKGPTPAVSQGPTANPASEPPSKVPDNPPAKHSLPSVARGFDQEQWQKHNAGQFDYVLSVPAMSAAAMTLQTSLSGESKPAPTSPDDQLYFGCNLVQTGTNSAGSPSDSLPPTYTLVATPIDAGAMDTTVPQGAEAQARGQGNMDAAPEIKTPRKDASQGVPRVYMNNDDSPPHMSPLRIEDSFEELDQLEEQLEAVDQVVRIERVAQGDKAAGQSSESKQTAVRRTSSVSRKSTGTVRSGVSGLSRAGSLRVINENQKAGSKPSTRRDVPVPASLRQPKPLAKSTKQATRPTFELPGEAVARRLKEQREERLAKAEEEKAAKAKSQTTLQRSRSAKLPTRPTFELPGEAISRRKKIEQQKRLQAEEEELRKRREFKAKPVRASLAAPATLPRETIASRARQSIKAPSTAEEMSPGGTIKKRLTIGGASPSRRPLSMSSASALPEQMRGRDTTAVGDAASMSSSAAESKTQNVRASSTSTSGGASQASSGGVTAEDVQQQKRRGREIYKRDNSMLSEERAREKAQRESTAMQARREAAERSREWARRQRSKRESQMMPSPDSPIAASEVSPTDAASAS